MNHRDPGAAKAGGVPVANDLALLCEAGRRHMRAGRNLDAMMACQQALALDPDHADALHLMGQLSLESGQYDLAVDWFARAIQQNPEANYLASLGTALQRQGRYDDAAKAMDKAVQLRPDDAGLWTNFGMVLEEMGRPSDALPCVQRALQLAEKHLAAALRSAALLERSSKLDEALLQYDLCDRLR